MNCLTQEKFESGSAENRKKHVQVDWEKEIVSEYIPICRIQQQLSYFHKCFYFVYSQVLVDKFQILFPVVNWGSHSKIRNNTYIQELSWISVLISRQLKSPVRTSCHLGLWTTGVLFSLASQLSYSLGKYSVDHRL